MKVAILGGGLAGTACAWALKQAGHEPVIYEAGAALAAGASGNEIGLYNPRFGAEMTPQSAYYAAAFREALQIFSHFEGIDFNPCGALHLINDEKKQIRFSKMIESWTNAGLEMEMLRAKEASHVAGVEISKDALYLPQSGYVSPKKLCAMYAKGVEIQFDVVRDPAVKPQDDALFKDADAIILACGPALREFEGVKHLPLGAVRGQVTKLVATPESEALKCNICYGGYVSKAHDGAHMVGASFQRWLDHSDVIDQDDEDNLSKLAENVPSLSNDFETVGHRASVRTTSRDHFPIVGQLSDKLYISTAHGSHGILSSLMGAKVLAAMITGAKPVFGDDVISALSPSRFQ